MELFEEIAERVNFLNSKIRVDQLSKENKILQAEIEVQRNHISDLETVNKFRLVLMTNKDAEIEELQNRISILEQTVKDFYEKKEAKND